MTRSVPPDPTSKVLTLDDIHAAIGGPIEPVRTTFAYRASLAVVAFVMVCLPLIYLALVGLLGWGMYWHATENVSILEGRGRMRGKFLVYAGPLVAGGILLAFLLKPFLAPRGRQREAIELFPDDEPRLFALVRRICDAVGAPMPAEIRVDGEVNASAARIERGPLGLWSSGLVLTIGLPLAGGLDLRQLAGVLAHEFGHFAQRTGMQLGAVSFRVQRWFARVVYGRDAWDEQLVHWSKEGGNAGLMLVLYITRGMVWLTRKILWALMQVGRLVSGLRLRQMEFDADRYEARLVGADTFRRTTLRLPVLGVGQSLALRAAQTAWSEQSRLADDLPGLAVERADALSPDEIESIISRDLARPTGRFDSHPAPAARIASVERERAQGVFRLDAPAAAVFSDFRGLCLRVTRDFYETLLGDAFSPERLVDAGGVIAFEEAFAARWRAFESMTGGVWDYRWPPFPDTATRRDDDSSDEQVGRALGELREAIAARAEEAHAALERLAHAEGVLVRGRCIDAVRRSGSSVPLSRLLPDGVRASTFEQYMKDDVEPAIESLRAAVRPDIERVASRLSLGLAWLRSPAGGRVLESEGCAEPPLDDIFRAVDALRAAMPAFLAIESECDVSEPFLPELDDPDRSAKVTAELSRFVGHWKTQLEALRSALGDARDPFAPAGEEPSLAVRTVPAYDAKLFTDVTRAAHASQRAFIGILRRLFAEIGYRVDIAERALRREGGAATGEASAAPEARAAEDQ